MKTSQEYKTLKRETDKVNAQVRKQLAKVNKELVKYGILAPCEPVDDSIDE
jgi:hypothetical protein